MNNGATNDDPSLAEAMAEIRRLRARGELMEGQLAELTRMAFTNQARCIALEMSLAEIRGTLAQPQPDEPAIITHDIPPNAPR